MTTATTPELSGRFTTETSTTPSVSRERVRSTALALGALALGHLAVDSCTGIWPVYKTLAGLDLARAGLIATLGGVLGNALQLAFGPLADRGLRRALLVGGVLASGAALGVGLTRSFWVHAALVLLTSLGSAAFHPAGAGAAGRLSGSRQGFVLAVFLAGGYVGFAFSQLAFTAAYRVSPAAPLALLLLPVGAALVLGLVAPPAAAERARTPGAARIPWARLAPLFVVQLLTSGLGVALIFLLPDLMAARHAAPILVAGGGHAAFILGGAVSLLPSGMLADRIGARTVLLAVNSLSLLLVAGLLGWSPSPALAVLLVALIGFCNSANNVVIVAEGSRVMPGQASAVSSLLMGLPWCFASLAPSLAGALAEPAHGGSPGRALAWMTLTLPLAIAVSALLPRRRHQR